MNDFTKEELQELIGSCCVLSNYYKPELIDSILKKLRVMLDNYCEHEETVNIGGWVSKCVKCGTKFGDVTQ